MTVAVSFSASDLVLRFEGGDPLADAAAHVRLNLEQLLDLAVGEFLRRRRHERALVANTAFELGYLAELRELGQRRCDPVIEVISGPGRADTDKQQDDAAADGQFLHRRFRFST